MLFVILIFLMVVIWMVARVIDNQGAINRNLERVYLRVGEFKAEWRHTRMFGLGKSVARSVGREVQNHVGKGIIKSVVIPIDGPTTIIVDPKEESGESKETVVLHTNSHPLFSDFKVGGEISWDDKNIWHTTMFDNGGWGTSQLPRCGMDGK